MGEKVALLDTSIIIDFFRKSNKNNSRFFQLSESYQIFCISVITEHEVFVGVTTIAQKEYWEEFLPSIAIIPLDSDTVQTAIRLNEALKKWRNQIDSADLFIAATALYNNFPLATLNTKHFDRVERLQLIP